MTTDAEIHNALPAALAEFRDPATGRPLAQTKQLRDVRISGGHFSARLALASHSLPIAQETVDRLVEHLRVRLPSVQAIDIETIADDRPIPTLGSIGLRCRSVIAVAAGKGGVGKSTVSAALALALQRYGCRVGLMDADVYGPSIPTLLGVNRRPEVIGGKIQPIDVGGMPVMSMGFLVAPDQAVVWRGPMLHGAVTQFLKDTDWGTLDYLIIDMPPGTGDIALTLSQLLPLSGSVIVCTPQEVALLDATKAIAMLEKVKIPIIGMVENMSSFTCPDTRKTYHIFGHGGARLRAEQLRLPFLGELPIDITLRELCDEGRLAEAFDDPNLIAPVQAVARATVRSLAAIARMSADTATPLPVLS